MPRTGATILDIGAVSMLAIPHSRHATTGLHSHGNGPMGTGGRGGPIGFFENNPMHSRFSVVKLSLSPAFISQ